MSYIIYESAVSSAISNIRKTPLGTIKFIAILQEADKPNRNHRIYPKSVLEPAIANSTYINERLRTNGLFGEAGHPLDTSVARQMNIVHSNISHVIHRLWWEGNLLMGELETTTTAMGRDLAGLIEMGYIPSFSLRAQGGVHQDPVTGCAVVEPGIQILTYDWVINPSHDKAFMQSICTESKACLFGSSEPSMQMLAESANMFDNGNLMKVEDKVMKEPITENYINGYNKALRHKEEIYFYDPADKIVNESITANYKYCDVINENVTKKVVLEDFLAKDIRNGIEGLVENIVPVPEAVVNESIVNTSNLKKSPDTRYNSPDRIKKGQEETDKTSLETRTKDGVTKYYRGGEEISKEEADSIEAEKQKNSFKFGK